MILPDTHPTGATPAPWRRLSATAIPEFADRCRGSREQTR